MSNIFSEKDWRTLRGLREELLAALCERINRDCADILSAREGTPHERYRRLYEHVRESDGIIRDCFDDLRRSTMYMKMLHMKRQGLLTAKHLECFSQEVRDLLDKVSGA
jgi:hypothetical protein